LVRPQVHSTKHYFQMSFGAVGTLAATNFRFAHAVNVVNKNQTFEVEEGSSIKAVYVELWLLNTSNDGSFTCAILKDTQDLLGPTFTEMAAIGDYNNKKNILFFAQGLTSNDGVGNPTPVYRGWLAIPKSKQRMGLGDSLSITLANPSANDLDFCGFVTYKEYT